MTLFEIAFLSVTVFATSAMSATVGAGGGTALIAIMLQFMSPAAAIPVHAAVQLAPNVTRVILMWRYMAWPLILRFSTLMPLGAWVGLELFQGLPTEVVKMLIGVFVLASLLGRNIGKWAERDIPLNAFVPIGFLAGLLNMVVGVVAPIVGVLILRKDMSKESMVGTLGFFGTAGSLLKVIGFSLIGFSFIEYGPLMLCMIPAAIIGTRVGRAFLGRLDEKYFLLGFRFVLVGLALKLIVIDGLGWMAL